MIGSDCISVILAVPAPVLPIACKTEDEDGHKIRKELDAVNYRNEKLTYSYIEYFLYANGDHNMFKRKKMPLVYKII